MKYFVFLSILYLLPLFTEQYLVIFKKDKYKEKSHEMLQMEPDAKLFTSAEVNELKDHKSKFTGSKTVLQSSEEEEIQEDTDAEESKELQHTGEVTEEEKGESDPGAKAENQKGMLFLSQVPDKFRGKMSLKFDNDDKNTHWSRWLSEIASGDNSEISGTNPRIYQPDEYPYFSRRFKSQDFKPELLGFKIDIKIDCC